MKLKAIKIYDKREMILIQIVNITGIIESDGEESNERKVFPYLNITYNKGSNTHTTILFFNTINDRDDYHKAIMDNFDFIDLPVRKKD